MNILGALLTAQGAGAEVELRDIAMSDARRSTCRFDGLWSKNRAGESESRRRPDTPSGRAHTPARRSGGAVVHPATWRPAALAACSQGFRSTGACSQCATGDTASAARAPWPTIPGCVALPPAAQADGPPPLRFLHTPIEMKPSQNRSRRLPAERLTNRLAPPCRAVPQPTRADRAPGRGFRPCPGRSAACWRRRSHIHRRARGRFRARCRRRRSYRCGD